MSRKIKRMFEVVALVSLALFTIGVAAQAATSWSLAGDITNTNPSGQWAYGYLDGSGAFAAYNSYLDISGSSLAFMSTNNDPGINGGVWKNYGSTDHDNGGAWFPVGQVVIDCGGYESTQKTSVVKWTAPSNMVVTIDTRFAGCAYKEWQNKSTYANVGVLQNGISLYSGTVAGFQGGGGHPSTDVSPVLTFVNTVSVTAGDQILFTVKSGYPWYMGGDAVEVDALITTVPEPASLIALLGGMAGTGCMFVRRRKSA